MPARPAFTATRSASAGTKLLEGGYVVEPRGDNIPYRALLNLTFDLATLNEGSYQYQEPLRTTGDGIAMYVGAGYLPTDIPIRHNDTMAEALELLASHGITPCMRIMRAAIGTGRNIAWVRRQDPISLQTHKLLTTQISRIFR